MVLCKPYPASEPDKIDNKPRKVSPLAELVFPANAARTIYSVVSIYSLLF